MEPTIEDYKTFLELNKNLQAPLMNLVYQRVIKEQIQEIEDLKKE